MKIYGESLFEVSKKNQSINPRGWSWQPVHLDWLLKAEQFAIKNDFEVHGKINKSFTLILSQKNVQTGALLTSLKKGKKPYVFIEWDKFSQKGEVHLSEKEIYVLCGQKKIDLKKAQSIYFSTPDLVEAQTDNSNYFTFKEKLYINRWAEVLLSLENVLKAKWFPAEPSKLLSLSQKKYSELHLAKKLGLNIPATIFSSSPKKAQEFFNTYKQVLLREFGRRVFINKKNQFIQIKNQLIKNDKFTTVEAAPCVFQQYLEKEFEVRAIVIGNKVLSCKIESQKNNKSKVDWRTHEGHAPFVKFNLPTQIQKKLVKIQKQLGFKISSFDLIYSKDKKYYFLEMNRPGSWFFIEALTGLNIRSELIKKF